VVALAERVDWFLAYKLSEADTVALTKSSCFRGTYGVEELSLFSCTLKGIDGKLFARLPRDAPLCVVETRNLESTLNIVNNAKDTDILFIGDDLLVLASNNLVDYPSTCGSRSDYRGAALNVMRVPRLPHIPLPPFTPLSSPLVINPRIVAIANRITAAQLNASVVQLASYPTRQSQSSSAAQAVDEISRNFTAAGATVTQQAFRAGYCNNVFGEIRGTTNPNAIVMLGAHLDSRSTNVSSTTQIAPGADDNASGVSIVLAIANAIRAQGATFQKTIRFATWCGEEQGLYGSAFAANNSRSRNENIDAYLNVDMLGYQPGAQPVLGIVDRSVSATFTKEIRDVVAEYYPSITQASTTVCCSDQQSYNSNGYHAGGIFEQGGTAVSYPQYHTSNDTPNRLSYTQLEAFARAAAAVFCTRAVIN